MNDFIDKLIEREALMESLVKGNCLEIRGKIYNIEKVLQNNHLIISRISENLYPDTNTMVAFRDGRDLKLRSVGGRLFKVDKIYEPKIKEDGSLSLMEVWRAAQSPLEKAGADVYTEDGVTVAEKLNTKATITSNQVILESRNKDGVIQLTLTKDFIEALVDEMNILDED